jgi:ABC-type bacteriocin/lantibiotic exporter with double-glycine peptidase domain
MFAALVHVVSLILSMFMIFIASAKIFPNTQLVWIITIVFLFATVINTILFFAKSKYWYYTERELEKEREKFIIGYNDIERMRSQYVKEFENKVDQK